MGLLRTLNKLRGGYPDGWKQYARGYQADRPPPFVQPNDPDDRRSLIPAMCLQAYWYSALPDKDELRPLRRFPGIMLPDRAGYKFSIKAERKARNPVT